MKKKRKNILEIFFQKDQNKKFNHFIEIKEKKKLKKS